MKWIQRGLQIGQAVKNVQRLRQILGVFAKHGFVDVVDRMNLGKFLPSRLAAYAASQADRSIAERLRLAFEELGPTFVKLGQVLSTRSDILPENFIQEFTKLQDEVQLLHYDVVRHVIETELKQPIDQVFASLSETPLAAASIGQVHEGVLKTGEKVVVKVQRPDIDRIIDTDVSLLAFLAGLLERYIPESRIFNPKIIVEEFFRTLSLELDFQVEANNMLRMAENMASIPEVVIPKVYRKFSTDRILVQEKFEGIRVNDLKAMDAAGVDRRAIVRIGARAFFKSILIDGVFHGDLHGGNVFVLPGNKIGLIDFGIVGRLSEKSRSQLANMVLALLTEDYENLCYQYAELGAASAGIDFDAFQREVRNTIAPYVGLSLDQLDSGRILLESTRIATKYKIQVPGDWMIVFKAILTMEGMGRSLDPQFDLLASGRELVKDLVKNQYSPQRITKDLLWVAKDFASLMDILPRHLRWMLKKLARDDFAFEIKSPQLEEMRHQIDVNSRRMSLTILSVGLFVASGLALQSGIGHRVGDYPVVAVGFFSAGVFFLLKLLLRGPK